MKVETGELPSNLSILPPGYQMSRTELPRKLWIMWHQGLRDAPFVVHKCIDSWQSTHPDWDVVILTRENVRDYIDFDISCEFVQKLNMAHQSDLIRLYLLAEHGGVWADATTFCLQPLGQWIDHATESGFFAFANPGPDRLISNWFLAAKPWSPIVMELRDRLTSFWTRHQYPLDRPIQKLKLRIAAKLFASNVRLAQFMIADSMVRVLRVYPYHAFHYLFAKMVREGRQYRQIWESMPKISAEEAHLLRGPQFCQPLSSELRRRIDDLSIPLLKLSHKYDHGLYAPGTALYYLLEGRSAGS